MKTLINLIYHSSKPFILLIILSFGLSQPDVEISGYLRQSEFSFCQDACGEFYIENEIATIPIIPVTFQNNFPNIELYINRFVTIEIGEEIQCVECSAFEINTIILSNDCIAPVLCDVDPCLFTEECQINTPVECISNYCGGCYADFYDLNGNLVDCYSSVEECIDGEINNDNPCNPMECWNGEWVEMIIDCAEHMGVPCLGGVYIPPPEDVCCSTCILFGDINNDYEINILDIVLLVGFILMTDNPSDSEFYAGDINLDGQLNILDVVAIVQLILNPIAEECYIIPEVGPCDGICPTYFFNQITNQCEEFITGCCGVDAFNTLEECQYGCE